MSEQDRQTNSDSAESKDSSSVSESRKDRAVSSLDESLAPAHAAPADANAASKKKRTIAILSVVLVVLLACAAVGIYYLVNTQQQMDAAAEKQDSNEEINTETLVENPIDSASLQAENPEIYAWIYIPGTKVNTPICQSFTDDNFYLDHDETGAESVAGAIFTQSMNAADFTDPVTLIYGHNMKNGGMFATLHYFEDEEFFNENQYFYIYTSTKVFTYEIVSAYQYDNRHILNAFDFSDLSVLQSYFDYVVNPTSLVVNKRDGISLTTDDRIVQLSTCRGDSDVRYLVTGVLVDEQGTY